MAKKKEAVNSSVAYTASKVIKRQSKGKSILQFTLTITFGEEQAGIEVRNCIMGIGKKGPWCTAPLLKYRPVILNKAMCDKLIYQFQTQGWLDPIVETSWAEETSEECTWIE